MRDDITVLSNWRYVLVHGTSTSVMKFARRSDVSYICDKERHVVYIHT